TRRLTDEELARAVHIDPRQIQGLGPSIEALRQILLERKRKILATYETAHAETEARDNFHGQAGEMQPPSKLAKRFNDAIRNEQLRDLERLWYSVDDERSKFARQLLQLVERLGEKYQVDEMASKWEFTGQTTMTVPQALAVKQELETIDKLLK